MAPNPACKTWLPMLSPFIDGELSATDRQTVERHLSACKDCTARVADLRAESGLLRLGMEMLADEADFTGFAQKVMAQVTPERPPLLERMRVALSEMFLYQRGALVMTAAGAAIAVLVGVLVLRDHTPEGYAGDRVVVQQVSAGDNATVQPVVSTTDSGNTIIWLVDQPSDDQKKHKKGQADQDEDNEEELTAPRHDPLKGGNL